MTPANHPGPHPLRQGVVLTGGGAKGAYEVGIMRALFDGRSPASDYRPLEVDIYTGTSVGAYNATYLAARSDLRAAEAADLLAGIWRERIGSSRSTCGNGVYRLRNAPLDAIEPACAARPLTLLANTFEDAAFWTRYAAVRGAEFLATRQEESLEVRALHTVNVAAAFDPRPLYELIEDTIDPEGLRRSDAELVVSTTDWRAGRTVLFVKDDLIGAVGNAAIAASTAIPGIFPPVFIGGVPFHDGGVLQNTPLAPAIQAGAEVIHVIFLDPRVVDIPLRLPPSTIDTAYRMFVITASTLLKQDIARLIEARLLAEAYLERLVVAERDDEIAGAPIKRTMQRALTGQLADCPSQRPLTVHIYRPKTDLGGGAGLLDFSSRFIGELIELGYQDAVAHDCGIEGCLLPEREETRS